MCVYVCLCIYVGTCIHGCVYVPLPAVPATLWHCCNWATLLMSCCIAIAMVLCQCYTGIAAAVLLLLCRVAFVSLLCHCCGALPQHCLLCRLAAVTLHCRLHAALPSQCFLFTACATYLLVALPSMLFTRPHALLTCLLSVDLR